MKKIFRNLMILGLCSINFLNAQTTTVTFKPNATIGKDAAIWMFDDNCIGFGTTQTNADRNFGAEENLWMRRWTWGSIGCRAGTIRSLLCFTELSTIPTNAVILSATLKLYGVSNDINSAYPGAPYSYLENTVVVQKVADNAYWNENTVTWNTMPTVDSDTSFLFTIGPSTSQYNWNCTNSSAGLVNMVQHWVKYPNYNNGMMMQLQTEGTYRNLVFASSDHADSTLWPELTVTYAICNADFSVSIPNVSSPNIIKITPVDTNGQHFWYHEADLLSTEHSPTLDLETYGNGYLCHSLFLSDNEMCDACFDICFLESLQRNKANTDLIDKKKEIDNLIVEQGKIIPGDIIEDEPLNNKIAVHPNPTTNNWQVKFFVSESQPISVKITDIIGSRTVYFETRQADKGQNSFTVSSSTIPEGIYILYLETADGIISTKITKTK
ncbi:MAG: T9SS type A sorting domain-containing protein [Bacteroidales bacterium]|nr:T9SS type A sorting domain-containing protein [Bacteroidales bacterium]